MKNTAAKNLKYFISAIFSVLPFILSFTTADGIVYRPMIAQAPQHLEMEKSCILFFGILCLIIMSSKFITKDKGKKKTALGLSIFFSTCIIFGKSYESIASWGYIFSSVSAFIASLCIAIGYTVMFYYGIAVLFGFIDNYERISYENNFIKTLTVKVEDLLKNNGLFKIWFILMLFWLPYIVINYPGIIHADSGVMLSEYNSGSLYNHHPVLQTIVWGSFVNFGFSVFGSYNVGVFLFVLIQFLYGSLIVSLLFNYVYKKGYPVPIILFSFIIIAVMPAFPRNATAVCKDSNYTFYVLFMVWLILKTIDLKENINLNFFKLIFAWIITVIFISFSRKSGIHIVLITSPFLIFYLRKYKNICRIAFTGIFIGIVIYFSGEYAIKNIWNIENDNIKETYSIQFQQTGRFIRDYSDDVTKEEAEIIDAVLEYDIIGEKYNPEIVDPVKNTFRDSATKEDFNKYMSVWFKQFFRHPTVYIQATLNTVYGYFYPENIGYYKDLFFMSNCIDESKIFSPEWLKKASEKLCEINMQSRQIPVIGLFSSLGFFVWCDIIIMVYFLFYKKDKKFLIYNIPAAVTILICIASPVNNTMRYGLAVMFLVPVFICMCFNKSEEGPQII